MGGADGDTETNRHKIGVIVELSRPSAKDILFFARGIELIPCMSSLENGYHVRSYKLTFFITFCIVACLENTVSFHNRGVNVLF